MKVVSLHTLSRDDCNLALRALLPAFIDNYFAADVDERNHEHELLSDAFADVRFGDVPLPLQDGWARAFGDDRVSFDVGEIHVWSHISRTKPIELRFLTGDKRRLAIDPATYGRASVSPPPKMGFDKQGQGRGGVRLDFCPQM